MMKPRIIIADTDINYLLLLQEKLVEEYFEQINLEIISEQEYFETLFQMPQKMDVLIVAESLFSESMCKHDIRQIFVLSENAVKMSKDTETVEYIYKYTTLKEVYSEIVSKCGMIFNGLCEKKNETQIILVSSANGGAGKTTVAMGIASSLAKKNKKVLYINAANIQSFQHWLSDVKPITALDVYAILLSEKDDIFQKIKSVIRKENFDYLPPFKASLLSLGIGFSVYRRIVQSVKNGGEYNYVILDTESVFNEDITSLMNIADKVLLVTNQTCAAVNALQLWETNIHGLNGDKYIVICNNYNNRKKNAFSNGNELRKIGIADYIEQFEDYEDVTIDALAKKESMQRITFLLI